MGTAPVFTPADVAGDWNRFGHTWVQLVDRRGEDTGNGLLTLLGCGGDTSSWRRASVTLRRGDGQNVDYTHGLPAGVNMKFAPRWRHKGYSMVETAYLGRNERSRCVWVSLTSARQYRYGLSDRAFTQRACGALRTVGQSTSVNFGTLAALWTQGPQFIPYDDLQLGRGQAISPALGLTPASESVSAICWNAKHVIGWYVDGNLHIERRSMSLARSLPDEYRSHTNYVRTEQLTDIYKEQVLPESMERGTLSSFDSPPISRRGQSVGAADPEFRWNDAPSEPRRRSSYARSMEESRRRTTAEMESTLARIRRDSGVRD